MICKTKRPTISNHIFRHVEQKSGGNKREKEKERESTRTREREREREIKHNPENQRGKNHTES